MSREIIMPKLGLTMTHGKITRWLKKEGDCVQAGETVLEIETDKINYDVESPVDGYILKILAEEGEDRDITTPLCIIGTKGEEYGQLEDKSLDTDAHRIFITPVAKKMAQENGIDLTGISGTGPGGRIQKEDIQNTIDATPQDSPITKRIPLAGIRKIIAARLTQSKHDIPHVYFKISVDAGNMMELKNKVSEAVIARLGRKLSLNDLIVKAVAAAIEEFPDFNSSLVENEIIYYKNTNIGVAVSSERGLVVPVVRNAGEKSFLELCLKLGELVDKARSGKLSLEEATGATFTVSNLGAYEIDEFSAIINPPESAILAVGRVNETPCVRNGEIVIRSVMNMTLSVDHRIIDGALAARFMKKLKDIMQEPYLILM